MKYRKIIVDEEVFSIILLKKSYPDITGAHIDWLQKAEGKTTSEVHKMGLMTRPAWMIKRSKYVPYIKGEGMK